MDTGTKVAKRRLSVLKLATRLGNVAEACRRRGIDRTSFYEWRQRFEKHGFEGLKDLPPIHKNHPQSTSEEVKDHILKLALKQPAYGCNRIETLLASEGKRVSAVTVQKILNTRALGTRRKRWLALEQQYANQRIELSREQLKFVEKQNPCFRERHKESSRPGELLCQDTFFIGRLKDIGKVYLSAVVDTYSSYAFGFLYRSNFPEAKWAIFLLHERVLPFFYQFNLRVNSILTDKDSEFVDTFVDDSYTSSYEAYLQLNEIEHRRTKVPSLLTNGFVERFYDTIFKDFFRIKRRHKDSLALDGLDNDAAYDVLCEDFIDWLIDYNYERPHLGYRNNGCSPLETVKQFVLQRKEYAASFAGRMLA